MDELQGIDVETLVLIVVGAHLRAELDDRPLAYRLRDRIAGQLLGSTRESVEIEGSSLVPIVCTDVWYLNNQELLGRPIVSIGAPGVNAATAYLANRLPTALMIDNTLRIQLDPEFIEVQACLWGVNAAATASALDMFVERYLGDFMRQAAD